MNQSFYSYVQTFRGGGKNDEKSMFAEAAFHDHSFPKQSTDFHILSRYIEEKVDEEMSARVFDELWYLYEFKYN
ncbi:YozE family protein [Viridibacillus arvi]|uniref:YozE family protein n=1 Tax=Viridibacillus arvi TaxID=263475 RepID=UPI003D2DB086